MDDNDDDRFETIATGITSTYFVYPGLTKGKQYKFRIQARNAVGYGAYSSEFAITASTVPSEPLNLKKDIPKSSTS